jgi:hypothetical protein
MRKNLAAIIMASGAVLIFAGLAYDLAFAGLPFQDPTPEMQENWLYHKRVANWITLSGGAVFLVGCTWTGARLLMRLMGWSRPNL